MKSDKPTGGCWFPQFGSYLQLSMDSLQQLWCPWSWQTKVGHFLASYTVESLIYDILLHIYWSSLVYMKDKLMQDYLFKPLYKVTKKCNKKEKSLKMKRDVGMASQKIHKQGKVKVNIHSPVPTSYCIVKRCRNGWRLYNSRYRQYCSVKVGHDGLLLIKTTGVN